MQSKIAFVPDPSPRRRASQKRLSVSAVPTEMNCDQPNFLLNPHRGSHCDASALRSGTTRLFVHSTLLHSSRSRAARLCKAAGMAEQLTLFNQPTHPGCVGSCCVRSFCIPNTFERARRALVPMTAKDRAASRPRRSGQAADGMIVVAGRRRCRRVPTVAVRHAEFFEFCEHCSPPIPRVAVGGEQRRRARSPTVHRLTANCAAIELVMV